MLLSIALHNHKAQLSAIACSSAPTCCANSCYRPAEAKEHDLKCKITSPRRRRRPRSHATFGVSVSQPLTASCHQRQLMVAASARLDHVCQWRSLQVMLIIDISCLTWSIGAVETESERDQSTTGPVIFSTPHPAASKAMVIGRLMC